MKLKEALNYWASDDSKEFGGPLKFRFKEVAAKFPGGNATLTDDVLFSVRGGDLAYSLDDLREDIYDFSDHCQDRENRKIKYGTVEFFAQAFDYEGGNISGGPAYLKDKWNLIKVMPDMSLRPLFQFFKSMKVSVGPNSKFEN